LRVARLTNSCMAMSSQFFRASMYARAARGRPRAYIAAS
jgi:hypothetical protein